MKPAKRTLSALLALTMVCSLLLGGLPRAQAADATLTGTIGLTLRFDLPQTVASAAGRNIQLQVSRNGQSTTVALPSGTARENGLGAAVSTVSFQNS